MKYRVHQFRIRMTQDQNQLEQFLNNLEGELVSIIPNVSFVPLILAPQVDFLLIIEKIG